MRGLTGSCGVFVIDSDTEGVRWVISFAFDHVDAAVFGAGGLWDFRIDLERNVEQ